MDKNVRQNRYLLANRIIDLARASRFEADYHLREQQLADMLQVSRTPIRAALMLLEEQGVVEARRNKGFFMKIGAEALGRVEVDVPTAPHQDLYARIVEDRLTHQLEETVGQAEITRRYGVDRNVLQKTLAALMADGLITRGPGRNWTFQPTLDTKFALDASYEFRRVIEPSGILMDSFRPHPTALEHIRMDHLNLLARPDINSLPPRQLFELDASFHETIAECSGNTFLLQSIQQQNRLRRLLEFASYNNSRRVREWCQEHLRIITALEEGDRARASELMRRHLEKARTSSDRTKRGG
ncbi:GntR family transcriptional regulator [Rhizobium sp. TRM96647]|uniref:GntR family transcriptional regulator n=1 Tax=unclassified Rhizobium TaxID=2613769 RepID=UPI0021E8B3E1|nr:MULTISPECIES: GntR family transcriptional regulator [unclassified Rhizobium]MCV3738652.1 GntR family transcriptional regulator [Rhizobium sp. TRM96647]MCV3760339.1 GntR family transcriptional regulator [Rhizobium sp. TRM96650]